MRIAATLFGIVGGLIALVSAGSLGVGALLAGYLGGGLVAALLTFLALGASLAGMVSGIVVAVRPRPGGMLMLAVGVATFVVFTLLSLNLRSQGVSGDSLENAYWLGGALLILGGILGLRAGRRAPGG